MPRSPPPPGMRRGRQGSPHPDARRRRQGSPHPNAIPGHASNESSIPAEQTASASAPSAGPQRASDPIPEFVSMAPAIYVPARFDYTKPRPSSLSSNAAHTERVDRAMAELEAHMDAVKRNIATIVEQQVRKVKQDAALQELALTAQGLPPPRSKRLPPSRTDDEMLLRNLEMPNDPRRTYGVGGGYGPHDVPEAFPNAKDTPREAAVTQISWWMRYGSIQMDGYEAHCETARKQTRERVAREVAKEMVLSFSKQREGSASAIEMESGGEEGVAMDSIDFTGVSYF